MDGLSASVEHSSCNQEFTMNLISNASMDTFPENTLSSFTTLLPTPIHLSGECQVALREIAWPNIIQNVTVGKFTVYKRNIQSPVEKRPRKHNRPGAISMAIPAAFESQSPASTLPFYTAPVKHRLKPGCYTSVDSILASITKIAMGEEQIGRKRISSSPDNVLSLLSWKVDNVTRKLHVKFCGNHKQYGLRIFTESNDLRNILGTNVIIDCGESQKEAVEEIDTESASNTIVKHVGKWPVDLNAGSHTMFLYCDLVQNQTLGDKQTALLRSIPVKSLALVQTLGEMNHKSFSNLQWKRVIKSQFQSINVTLANEMGQKIPFLSCGRTNVTLAFRPTPRH